MRLIHILLLLAILTSAVFAQQLDLQLFEDLKPRSIGPAGMSGRVTAIDVVLNKPEVMYVGTASGGLWKSESGGVAWEPVFDSMNVASIGAVAIDQRNPDVIWVGTGEGNPRNSQNSGNGVYKSLDGGKSWLHLGLEQTRNIHRLIVNPHNPDIVYVGAIGAAWGNSPDRGVYKTTNGGASWEKILYVNDKTGVGDLVMDPVNPNKLICAMWEYRRWPWFFQSGGEGSGLYVTYDGGKSWKKRTDEDGLPKGELGRIGVAIARSSPNIIYALIEAKKNALYKSTDGGFKWSKVSDKDIGNRPFYYAEIYVDPANENRIYNLFSIVTVSEDGGKSFTPIIPWNRVHPDHHAFWIHPHDANFIIDGNDGGLAISRDRGKTWRFVENLPLGQFYHISVDNDLPYNVYGGLQDNGSWRGPSYVWRQGGILNAYWEMVGFGDGFDTQPDPGGRFVYGMSQGGELYRYDILSGEQKSIRPIIEVPTNLRFNWNAGLARDPFNPSGIYYGSQFVHYSSNKGDSWKTISPDLTTNDTSKQKQLESGGLTYDVTAAENHCTIIAISPSPLRKEIIWVGTDDGNVQLTQDGGASWTNVVKSIKAVPESTWVPHIYASTYNAGEAFVLFENHRRNDWTPYVFRTTDFGRSWTRLAQNVWGFALSFAQDPVEPKLMFLGTEFGLYISIDAGQSWTKWKHNFPPVPVTELIIHPTEHDLVIGTFGRAIFVLDDVRPLRTLANTGSSLLQKHLKTFTAKDAFLAEYKSPAGVLFSAEAGYSGENRPYGAMLTFIFNPDTAGRAKDGKKSDAKERKDTVTVEILDGNGTVIRTVKREAKKGFNRIQWNLDRRGERWPSAAKPEAGAPEPGGVSVVPGTYTVRLRYAKHVDSTTVRVHGDPRLKTTPEAMAARDSVRNLLLQQVRIATEAADRLRDAKKTIEQINAVIKSREDTVARNLRKKGSALSDSIKVLDERINQKEVQGILRDPSLVSSQLGRASSYINSSWDMPGETERIALAASARELQMITGRINDFFAKPWKEYQSAVAEANVTFFQKLEPLNMNK